MRSGAVPAPPVCPYVYPPNCSGCEASLNTAIYAYFPVPLDPSSVTAATFTVVPSRSVVPTGPALPGAVSYDTDSRAAVFRPATALLPNASYLLASGPGLRYEDGAPLEPTCFYEFRTGGAADRVPPVVVDMNPPPNRDAETTEHLWVDFSEDMDPTTVNAGTFLVGDGVAGTVLYDPRWRSAVFLPSNRFPEDTDVTATVTPGVRDAAGNPLAEPFTWTFHVAGAGPLDPPEVVRTDPGDEARGVARNTAIQVFFDEDLDPATVNADTFRVDGGVTGAVVYNASFRAATFYPAAPLAPRTTYTVTVAADVKDAAGYRAGADRVWRFQTGDSVDTEAPKVSTESPERGSTWIAYHCAWCGGDVEVATIYFSEAIDFNSLSLSAVLYDGQPLAAIARTDWLEGTSAITFPTSRVSGTSPVTHRITVTHAVTDLAGNPFGTDETWTFSMREATELEDCLYLHPDLGEEGCRNRISSGGGGGGGTCFLEALGSRVGPAAERDKTASPREAGTISGGGR